MERKLRDVAGKLPEPMSNFSKVEEKLQKNVRRKPYSMKGRMKLALIACLILLVGVTGIAASSEINFGAWIDYSGEFEEALKVAKELKVVIPDALNESPFYEIDTLYDAPEGTTYLEALKNPAYKWYYVSYGIKNVIRENDSEYVKIEGEYNLSAGSMDNELYKYVFGLDENDIRQERKNERLEGFKTIGYAGITMQLWSAKARDTIDEKNTEEYFYMHNVLWVDPESKVVFQLGKTLHQNEKDMDQFPMELINIAEGLIDINTRK